MPNTLAWLKFQGHYRQIILLQGNLLHMHLETHSQTHAKALHKSHGHTIEQICIFMLSHPYIIYESHNCSEIPSSLITGFLLPKNSSHFEKPEFLNYITNRWESIFYEETVHRNKLLLASVSHFLSTGTHISDGASKGWKYDLIWLPYKHFLKQEYSHRGQAQNVAVYQRLRGDSTQKWLKDKLYYWSTVANKHWTGRPWLMTCSNII